MIPDWWADPGHLERTTAAAIVIDVGNRIRETYRKHGITAEDFVRAAEAIGRVDNMFWIGGHLG